MSYVIYRSPGTDGQSEAVSCPYCSGNLIVRLRRQGLGYRLRRKLTKAHLYRCRDCHRDFWQSAKLTRGGRFRVEKRGNRLGELAASKPRGEETGLSTRQYVLALFFAFGVAFFLIVLFGKRI